MSGKEFHYESTITWTGNTGEGTASYLAYERDYRVAIRGKPVIAGSADPEFRGRAGVHNPEDLFLSAIAACHMLFFLALCARGGKVRVTAYEDRAAGTMRMNESGDGSFVSVVLRPHVTVTSDSDVALAETLHRTAHERCFITNSCRMPILVEPVTTHAAREKIA